MANYKAIEATSKAILGLIEEHCPRSETISPEFKLYHAEDFERHMSEGFSLYPIVA